MPIKRFRPGSSFFAARRPGAQLAATQLPVGTETSGRAEANVVGCLVSGVLLVLSGVVVAAWLIYRQAHQESSVYDLIAPMRTVSTPYDWAFPVALVAVGIGLLLRRRAARGGALLAVWIMAALVVREAVGIANTGGIAGLSPAVLVTLLGGFVASGVVLVLLLRGDGVRLTWAKAFRVAGWLMLGLGVLRLLSSVISALIAGAGIPSILTVIVNPAAAGPNVALSSATFYLFAQTIAFILVGALAVMGRRVARGAAFVLLGVTVYVSCRDLIAHVRDALIGYQPVNAVSVIGIVMTLLAIGVSVGGLSLLVPATDRRLDASGTAGLPAPAGDLGQQHTGGHGGVQ